MDLRRLGARGLEHPGGDVHSGHLGAGRGGSDRDFARAGRDVQPPLAPPGSQPLDEPVLHRREPLGQFFVLRQAPQLGGPLCQSCSFASAVSSLRASQSSGYSSCLISFPSSSTGVPCVPTTSSPITRATTL